AADGAEPVHAAGGGEGGAGLAGAVDRALPLAGLDGAELGEEGEDEGGPGRGGADEGGLKGGTTRPAEPFQEMPTSSLTMPTSLRSTAARTFESASSLPQGGRFSERET